MVKGYINYVLSGLRQLFHCIQLENLSIEQNNRLRSFFESNYYYVFWEYENKLFYCTKCEAMRTIEEMAHPIDSDYNAHDITIIGEDFENSDILCFNHDDEIFFYQKCGRLKVELD